MFVAFHGKFLPGMLAEGRSECQVDFKTELCLFPGRNLMLDQLHSHAILTAFSARCIPSLTSVVILCSLSCCTRKG